MKLVSDPLSLARARALSLSLSVAAATGSKFLFLRILEQDVRPDEGYVSRFIETIRFTSILQVNARLVVQQFTNVTRTNNPPT